MATELNEQAIQVTTKATQITLAGLKAIIQTMLSNRHPITHGEQSIQKLSLQNKQLESVNLSGDDIKEFRKQLNKYSVDFHVQRDKSTGLHTVFFKSQDTDRIYLGLESCMKKLTLDRSIKKPIKEVMENAVQRAAEQAQQHKAPEKSRTTDKEAI